MAPCFERRADTLLLQLFFLDVFSGCDMGERNQRSLTYTLLQRINLSVKLGDLTLLLFDG